MAELENQVEENQEEETTYVDETTENNEDYQDDSQEDEQITYEQALKWKEDLKKASAKLAELKKAEKEQKKVIKKENSETNPEEIVRKLLAEEKFFDKNPEAIAYKDKIKEYQNKGLSLDDAYILASKEDRENEKLRDTYWQWFVKWQANTESIWAVSIEQFDSMTETQQEEYTSKMTAKYWKVKFKY